MKTTPVLLTLGLLCIGGISACPFSTPTARPPGGQNLMIFGTVGAPWNPSLFHAVDDRVRGGSSESHMEAFNAGLEAKFYGTLDTKTLGGAGFASQVYSPSPPLSLPSSQYYGLRLTVRPPDSKHSASPQSFVLSLKDVTPETNPDGSRNSTIVYEYAFDLTNPQQQVRIPTVDNGAHRSIGPILTFEAPWAAFQPTYRGRPQPDAPGLNTLSIKEISLMCRSNFGQQSGPFELHLVALEAMWWHWRSTNDLM